MKRKMNKRLARLCLCLMLVYLFVPVLPMPVHAEEKEKAGWVLQAVLVDTNEEEYHSYNSENIYHTFTYKEYGYLEMHVENPWYTLDITSQASPMPKSFYPGDAMAIHFDFDIQADISKEGDDALTINGGMSRFSMPEGFDPREFKDKKSTLTGNGSWFTDSDGYGHSIEVGIGDDSQEDALKFTHYGTDIIQNGSQITGTIPEGQPGELLEIGFLYYHVGYLFPLVYERYLYTWEGSASQEVIGEAGSGSGETGTTIESGIIKPGSDDGDDDDGNVAGTVAKVGGGAAGAAIAVKAIKSLIGKSGKSGNSGGDGGKGKKKKKRGEEPEDEPRDEPQGEPQDEQKEEKKSYEMRVFKEFGDTIYVGKTVTLSARIVEISASGVERTAPELTKQITISSSNYLQVGGTFLSGQYQSAQVTAPECDGAPPSTALVTFRLVAPGGSFTQHMRFKIKQADPRVVWPDQKPWASDFYLDIIAGDNATYPVRFFFHDVDQEPEKIVFGQYNDYEITVEPADTMYTYWARIKNRTAPLDNQRIYGYEYRNGMMDFRNHYLSDFIGFTATFKGGLELTDSIRITRYPEGLSVFAEMKDGRIPVQAYKREDYSGQGLDGPYQASSLRYTCARRTESGVEVLQPEDDDLIYGKLQGDKGEKENNVAMKYEYNATATYFEPLKTLYESKPGDTYLMKIDVAWKEKPDDVLTLPLTFRLKPKTPMEEWNKEFKKLQQLIVNFSVPETIEVNLAKIKRITPQNTSSQELRLFNEAIVKDYMAYWDCEARCEIAFDKYLEDLEKGAGWVDFLGDCAFTYIIYYYSSLYGQTSAAPYLDAILSPAKDLMEEFAGRCTWAYIDSSSLDWDGLTKLATEKGKSALDDVLFEMIPDEGKDFFKLKSVNLKKVGLMIACYMMANFAMNLAKNRLDMDDSEERKKHLQMNDEEFEEATSWTSSIYTALLDTFKDMSVKFITSIVGKNIEEYLEKPDIREKLGKWVSGILDFLWRQEKGVRVRVMGTKQAYYSKKALGKAVTLDELYSRRLDMSTLNKITSTAEEMGKLYQKKADMLCEDVKKLAKREDSFSAWKEKVEASIQMLPEKEFSNIVSLLCSKKWFFTRKGGGWWGYSFGMLFDKLVNKGAGKVYDLTTGEMIKQKEGQEKDLAAQAEAEQAAMEMEAQVEAKKLLAQLILDVDKAETPEEVKQLMDRFQKEIEPPQDEEQDDDEYAFDPDPEFKTGEDGCTYVVLKFRKKGTNEGYRFEYNLSKMLRNLTDSELGIEFVKSLFGGSVPELPEGKLPMPDDPPLPSELN